MERIIVKNISKTYKVGSRKPINALRRVVLHLSDKAPKVIHPALCDVSFAVQPGEIVGLIGRNGSGKSTLLRIMAGIIQPDVGRVETKGRVVAFLGLDAGMKAQLTMKENIVLFCTLLGMNRQEIGQRFDTIIKFAELKDFVNSKWHQLSDGMKQRAVLSTVLHTEPDVLLLDESFSSGDKFFNQKSVTKIEELSKKGAAVILASHGLYLLESASRRAIWMEAGQIRQDGPSSEVISAYKIHGQQSVS